MSGATARRFHTLQVRVDDEAGGGGIRVDLEDFDGLQEVDVALDEVEGLRDVVEEDVEDEVDEVDGWRKRYIGLDGSMVANGSGGEEDDEDDVDDEGGRGWLEGCEGGDGCVVCFL